MMNNCSEYWTNVGKKKQILGRMNKYWELQTNVTKKSQGQNTVQSFENKCWTNVEKKSPGQNAVQSFENLYWESQSNVGNDEQLFEIMNKYWEEWTNIGKDEQILGIRTTCLEKVTGSKCSSKFQIFILGITNKCWEWWTSVHRNVTIFLWWLPYDKLHITPQQLLVPGHHNSGAPNDMLKIAFQKYLCFVLS